MSSNIFKPTRDKLIHNNKIEVRKSSVHGYGVFAIEEIKKGEILEECHVVEVDAPKHPYVFTYPKSKGNQKIVFSTGFGSIYNTAEDAYGSNANWITKYNLLTFIAIKDIKKDEEIFINYSNFLYFSKNGKGRKVETKETTYQKELDSFVESIVDTLPRLKIKRTKPKPFRKTNDVIIN